LTSASQIAAAACHRAAAGLRTVRRAVVRRWDAWLYGLDQEYPEYDAYRRRPRQLARAVRVTMLAAETVAAVAVTLGGAFANRWAQRPSSDTRPAAAHRSPAAPMPRTHVDGRVHRVQFGNGDPVPRTDSWNSPGSDVSDPPGSNLDPISVDAASPAAAPTGAAHVPSVATTTDTRHTSAIPSTFAPGAA
jgi:hypothetical protein